LHLFALLRSICRPPNQKLGLRETDARVKLIRDTSYRITVTVLIFPFVVLVACSDERSPSPVVGELAGIQHEVLSHCGVVSTWFDGQLWLADPPLGDHNPPPGWDENRTSGRFVKLSETRAEFRTAGGSTATFRLAPEGAKDPNEGCE
jgi:hypothetical protein